MTLLEIVLSCLLVLETIVMIIVVYSFFKLKKMLTSSLTKTGSKLLESMIMSQSGSNKVHDISDVLDKMMSDRFGSHEKPARKHMVDVNEALNEALNKAMSDMKPERDKALEQYKAKDNEERKDIINPPRKMKGNWGFSDSDLKD